MVVAITNIIADVKFAAHFDGFNIGIVVGYLRVAGGNYGKGGINTGEDITVQGGGEFDAIDAAGGFHRSALHQAVYS